MASVESTSPTPSTGGRRGSPDAGTTASARRSASAASGTFIQNVAGQPLDSSRAPPTIGPSATATPVVAPHRPIALARAARSGNRWTIVDSVAGKMTAAPTPMRARQAISASLDSTTAAAPLATP